MSFKSFVRDVLSEIPILDGMFRRFVWSRIHFPENEMRFLNSLPKGAIDIAIDVGAATGSYAWILNRVSKQVFAFEPGEVHNNYLNRVNFLSRINVISAAVGDCSKAVSFFTPGTDVDALHSATVSSTNPVTELEETSITEVQQISLDEYFDDLLDESRNVDLIKVDVEGYENEVFRGCGKLLERCHPVLICEIEARHNPRYAEVFQQLQQLDYACYIYRGDKFEIFTGNELSELQREEDLATRLSDEYDPVQNRYINNFVFQHSKSRIKVI